MTASTASTTTSTTPVPQEQNLFWPRVRMLLSYALLFLIALAFIYPFILAIATSFKTLPEIAVNPVSPIPQTFTLDGYQRMFALNVDREPRNRAPRGVSPETAVATVAPLWFGNCSIDGVSSVFIVPPYGMSWPGIGSRRST